MDWNEKNGPQQVNNSTIPMDILQFDHSYGYDCQRYFNFCVIDLNTIIFASGCLIHIFDLDSKTLKFRRGLTGRGIGHITKNPKISHIAMGENGINPPIIIYHWPNFEIITILNEGTTRSYSHLSYSPDGNLLVSQGGEPDYLITVWNWEQSSIILRCKSHSQDIYNVIFSTSISGHIVTSGVGHIKFWQISSTYTGLKLKGELGRFGRTEITDIIGILAMADGKVVSGCEWGNILLWDEGLIKLEVRRKNKKTCHDKMITQFEYNNSELISIGKDGFIRIWYYDTIDQANPPDDDRFIGVEPIYEFKISEYLKSKTDNIFIDSILMSIQKKDPNNPDDTFWYAQDGNGGFWLIDLNTVSSIMIAQPKKIFICHAGSVNDISVCDWGEFLVSCGEDGRLNIYNYIKKKIILSHKFNDHGTCVIWLPHTIDSTGSTIISSFKSGILRVITISIKEANALENDEKDFVRLIQVIKPHTKSITAMSFNSINKLLVTGSSDSTVFVFFIVITDKYPSLVPIGFVNTPSGVTCMTWKPQHLTTILVGCFYGDCVEIDLPDKPQSYTTVSYELIDCKMRIFKFHSIKSTIRREYARLENEKNRENRKKNLYKKLEELKAINPAIEIDEEIFLMDTEEDPPLPDIYIPEIPNQVLTINYSGVNTIYLTMAGFDCGYIYEYPIPQDHIDMPREPLNFTEIYETTDTEICSCFFFEDKYLIMGTEHGEIRVCQLENLYVRDISDYWSLFIHDYHSGRIKKILLSYNSEILFTCGDDGNIFSFVINNDEPRRKIAKEFVASQYSLPQYDVDDIEEADHPSLQQIITQNEKNRILLEVNKRKDEILMRLREMSEEYRAIMHENSKLLKSQQIPQEEFELDSRITEDLNNHLKSEMNLVYEKMAYNVEKSRLALKKITDHYIKPFTCIPFAVSRISKSNRMVHSLEEKRLDENFMTDYTDLLKQLTKDETNEKKILAEKNKLMIKSSYDSSLMQIDKKVEEEKIDDVESFLKGLSPSTIQYKLGTQINHLLKKYRDRRKKMEKRAQEWKIMNACKPDPNVDNPEDIEAIERAKQTIGDYKLKTSMNFNLNDKFTRETTLNKYKELLDCRKKIHCIRVDFNEQLKAVRDKKLKLQEETKNLIEKLKSIHAEIPEKYIKPIPEIFDINFNIEYPEKNLELEKYITVADRVKEARRIRQSNIDEIKVTPMDEEYEILLLDEQLIKQQSNQHEKSIVSMNFTIYQTQIHIPEDLLTSLNENDRIKSKWEHEMKLTRMERKIYEQNQIIDHINQSYDAIDNELDKLERDRLNIQVDSCYSELHQLTLHQELIILRDCEVKESLLTEKVNENLAAQADSKQKIQHTTTNIDKKKREIAKLQDNIKEISSKFSNMINDNKFEDYLQRIFKKKYKPPKVTEDSSTDSLSTDSLSEDDSDISGSREFELYHLNENICPIGCDNELYNVTFTLRSQRHDYECQIKDNLKIIDSLKREIEEDTKKLKIIENSLGTSQQELLTFMQEKQKKLNSIETTILLKLNQLPQYDDSGVSTKIQDCVLFDKGKLSQLYSRVDELKQETIEQRMKHRKNQAHLHRLEIDCQFMNGEIQRLNEQIDEEMFHKFGKRIPLTDLYEAVLKRMVIDIKSDMKDIIKAYDKEILCIKKKYNKQVIVLENLIQDNTEKLSFLTILEEENGKLEKILKHNPESEESMLKVERDYARELAELEIILKNQQQQQELFRNEIQKLQLKTNQLSPIHSRKKIEKSQNHILKLDKVTVREEIKTPNDSTNH